MKMQAIIFCLGTLAAHGLNVASVHVPHPDLIPEEEDFVEKVDPRVTECTELVDNEVRSNFSKRHSMRDLRAKLEAILSTTADPDRADMLVNGLGWDGGYGSRVLTFVNQMALALYFQRSVVVCNSTFLDKVYTEFYEAPAHMAIFNDPARTPRDTWGMDTTDRCSHKLVYIARDKFTPSLMALDFEFISNMKRFLYDSLLTLKPSVENEIASRLAARGLQPHTRYLGVHIRHGDKGVELMDGGIRPTKQYADAIQKELDSTGIRSVYVASDDPNAGTLLKDMLNPEVNIWHRYVESSKNRSYAEREAVLDFLTDIQALRQSHVFIGTQSSNVGRMVYYGRPDYMKSISLDGAWSKCPFRTSDASCIR